MKRLSFILGALLAMSFIACDDDKNVDFNDLPGDAQTFMNTHFQGVKVNRVEKDNNSYDVYLEGGIEVEFSKSGVWDDVENKANQALPQSVINLIPTAIPEYVTTNYPNQVITKINKEPYGFEIDLNNGLDLEFNSDGSFRRIDD